jgi:dCMP deaminase
MRPCFGCTKELLQAKVKAVFYMHDWKHPDPDVWHEYEKLQQRFPGGIRKLEMEDPDKDWAVGSKARPPEESGHSIPGN